MKNTMKTLPFALLMAASLSACDKPASSTETYKHPSDSVRQDDGTYRYMDGSVHNADGSLKTAAPKVEKTVEKPIKPDAMSQGNAQTEIDVTAAIRKAVLAREGMSMAGKNVTIVTEKTTVTLKGEVATAAEKAAIGEIASANAAGRTVDNQIVVKP